MNLAKLLASAASQGGGDFISNVTIADSDVDNASGTTRNVTLDIGTTNANTKLIIVVAMRRGATRTLTSAKIGGASGTAMTIQTSTGTSSSASSGAAIITYDVGTSYSGSTSFEFIYSSSMDSQITWAITYESNASPTVVDAQSAKTNSAATQSDDIDVDAESWLFGVFCHNNDDAASAPTFSAGNITGGATETQKTSTTATSELYALFGWEKQETNDDTHTVTGATNDGSWDVAIALLCLKE